MEKRPEFQAWMKGTNSSALWCTGKLGAGKTVLSAAMIAHIIKEVSPEHTVSYFMCRYDDIESLKARTIFGSIARQFLSDLPVEDFS